MKTDTNNRLGPVTGDQPQDTTGIATAYIPVDLMGPKEQDLDNVIAVNHTKFEGFIEPVGQLNL